MARPLLVEADRGEDALSARLRRIGRELRIACFYAGIGAARDLDRAVLRPR
jgi:isopentenyl diphosphate isomerase/L-lactate dehydrogenase-like FMN-dependent dehydrogenase